VYLGSYAPAFAAAQTAFRQKREISEFFRALATHFSSLGNRQAVLSHPSRPGYSPSELMAEPESKRSRSMAAGGSHMHLRSVTARANELQRLLERIRDFTSVRKDTETNIFVSFFNLAFEQVAGEIQRVLSDNGSPGRAWSEAEWEQVIRALIYFLFLLEFMPSVLSLGFPVNAVARLDFTALLQLLLRCTNGYSRADGLGKDKCLQYFRRMGTYFAAVQSANAAREVSYFHELAEVCQKAGLVENGET
jgi:hypothetical protein